VNAVTTPIIAVAAACLLALAPCILLPLSGCATPPEEGLADTMEWATLPERLEAVTALGALNSRASVSALLEAFPRDDDTREEVASALVLKGRDWYLEHPDSAVNGNRVLAEVHDLSMRSDLSDDFRGKACWVIAEVGWAAEPGSADRNTIIDALKGTELKPGTYAGGSTLVGEEIARGLRKMGYSGEAHRFECLADGSLLDSYDPRERGHLPEEETSP